MKRLWRLKSKRDIKIVTTGKRRSKLEPEHNCNTKNNFSEKILAIEMNRTNIELTVSGSVTSKHEQNSYAQIRSV